MLYGISLNADGTTKVVAQRLATQGEPAAAPPAGDGGSSSVPEHEPVG